MQRLVDLPILCALLLPYYATWTHASPVPNPLEIDVSPQDNATTAKLIIGQVTYPKGIFAVLLIIGGDIVHKAIAQYAGRRLIQHLPLTVIPFSFGWVSYSITSLMSALGDGDLMPKPDIQSYVITISTGTKKSNNSWIIGRLLRDLESRITKKLESWYEECTEDDETTIRKTTDPSIMCKKSGEADSELLVTLCEAQSIAKTSAARWQCLWAYATVATQLLIAGIPYKLHRNWYILLLTGAGNLLAIITVSIPAWKRQKYQARRGSKNTFAITRGNGHPHIVVVKPGTPRITPPNTQQNTPTQPDTPDKYPGLFLDDLAGSVGKADLWTRLLSAVLALCWIIFLIIATGVTQDPWYLLGVGILGLAYNVFAAGRHCSPDVHGIPLRTRITYGFKRKNRFRKRAKTTKPRNEQVLCETRRPRVMDVLKVVELHHHGVGAALRPEFFDNAALSEDESQWWAAAAAHAEAPRLAVAMLEEANNLAMKIRTAADEADEADEAGVANIATRVGDAQALINDATQSAKTARYAANEAMIAARKVADQMENWNMQYPQILCLIEHATRTWQAAEIARDLETRSLAVQAAGVALTEAQQVEADLQEEASFRRKRATEHGSKGANPGNLPRARARNEVQVKLEANAERFEKFLKGARTAAAQANRAKKAADAAKHAEEARFLGEGIIYTEIIGLANGHGNIKVLAEKARRAAGEAITRTRKAEQITAPSAPTIDWMNLPNGLFRSGCPGCGASTDGSETA